MRWGQLEDFIALIIIVLEPVRLLLASVAAQNLWLRLRGQ